MSLDLPPIVLLISVIVMMIAIILLAVYFARRLLRVERRQAQRDVHLCVLKHVWVLTDGAFEHTDEFLDQLVLLIHDDLRFDQFGIGLANAEGKVVYRAGYGLPEEWKTQLAQLPGEGIAGWVFQTGEPLLVPDVRRDARYREVRASTRSELCVPLRIKGRVVSVINAESDRPSAFTKQDLRLLMMLASLVSGTLERLMEQEKAAQQNVLKSQALTERELAVLRGVEEGLSNYEIARRLKRSPHTIEHHLTNIYRKLGVSNRTEAVVRAREQGLWGDKGR